MLPRLVDLLEQALAGAATARRVLAFWGPVIDAPALVGPLLAIASALTLALLVGVAVGALATLMLALLLLFVLLTEVFGISVDLSEPHAAPDFSR